MGSRPQIGDTDEKVAGHTWCTARTKLLPQDKSPMADVLTGKDSGVYDGEVHIRRPDGRVSSSSLT